MQHEISLKDILIRWPACVVVASLVAMAAPESWRNDAIQVVAYIAVYGWAGMIFVSIMERSVVVTGLVVILSLIGLVI